MMYYVCKGAAMFGFKELCKEDVGSHQLQEQFHLHMEQEGLSYGTKEEYQFRFDLFKQKDAIINEWNNKQDSFELEHNMFSTMTEFEAQQMLGGVDSELDIEPTIFDESNISAEGINWVGKHGVNPIKNQGRCGSCWAFSATSVTENAHFRATGKLLQLSEQQLVSCTEGGCHGGGANSALYYLQKHAQVTGKQYPYVSGGNGNRRDCDDTRGANGVVQVQEVKNIQAQSRTQLKAAIETGVVSVTIEADKAVFQHYKRGIFNTAACGTKVNHAVSLVGWGSQNGHDYYILRNSWSTRWGAKGYMLIAAYTDGPGVCGIQVRTSYIATTN